MIVTGHASVEDRILGLAEETAVCAGRLIQVQQQVQQLQEQARAAPPLPAPVDEDVRHWEHKVRGLWEELEAKQRKVEALRLERQRADDQARKHAERQLVVQELTE